MVAGRAEWIERMRVMSVPTVAAALGIEATMRSNKWSAPCPACNAARRHTKTRDKRGAVGVRPDGAGWHCFQCEASGDALDFVAYHRAGKALGELSDAGKADVREWCCRWLGLDLGGPGSGSTRRPAHGSPFSTDRGGRTVTPLPAATPRPSPTPAPPAQPPNYPPADEVAALWALCVRADEHPAVLQWLADRLLDAQDVADRDLARALPPTVRPGDLPAWARAWPVHGCSLIVQLVDAHGVVRSMVARSVRPKPERKTRPPYVHGAPTLERRGLVFACGLARQVLATAQRPEWWPADLPLQFEVTEGEKKFCIRGVERSDAAEHAPAVLAVESGSWTAEIAARIPDGASVYIATDANTAGAHYATAIVRSLRFRDAVRIVLRPGLRLASETGELMVKVT